MEKSLKSSTITAKLAFPRICTHTPVIFMIFCNNGGEMRKLRVQEKWQIAALIKNQSLKQMNSKSIASYKPVTTVLTIHLYINRVSMRLKPETYKQEFIEMITL